MIHFIITTLVLEYDQSFDVFHSFLPNKAEAYRELLEYVNAEYADPSRSSTHFDSWDEVKGYFDHVYISSQEIQGELTNLKTSYL